jgi:hypothetical protein
MTEMAVIAVFESRRRPSQRSKTLTWLGYLLLSFGEKSVMTDAR